MSLLKISKENDSRTVVQLSHVTHEPLVCDYLIPRASGNPAVARANNA